MQNGILWVAKRFSSVREGRTHKNPYFKCQDPSSSQKKMESPIC